jgi:hypothetical protein
VLFSWNFTIEISQDSFENTAANGQRFVRKGEAGSYVATRIKVANFKASGNGRAWREQPPQHPGKRRNDCFSFNSANHITLPNQIANL